MSMILNTDTPKYESLEDLEIKAKYKIEIKFGRDRTTSVLRPSTGVVSIWASGKRLHGGGDEQMCWCGYPDCGRPIELDMFSMGSVRCNVCNRESFSSTDSKQHHVAVIRAEGGDVASFDAMPVSYTEKFFKLSPPKIADLLYKIWMDLGGNADIYLKYHPLDMRYDPKHEYTRLPDKIDAARAQVSRVIYPLSRIIKDTSAGAEPRKRFLALLTA